MKNHTLFALAFIAASAFHTPNAASASYAGQEERAIKALSAEEVRSLRDGKGMGFAKAAELNSYPGPSHVLQLAEQLQLSASQKEQTAALFKAMEAKARKLGNELVEAERELDQLFASRSATAPLLETQLAKIGNLQAQVRGTHLAAHIAQAAILKPEQIAQYDKLRGYHNKPQHDSNHAGHQH